jgi:ribosomal-protein-serine acetyltransferase
MFSLRVDDEVTIELAEMHHADAIYALSERNREHLAPWMPWIATTTSVADTVGFLTFIRGEYGAGRAFHGNLRLDGELVGGIGMRIDATNKRAEIGYWIDKAAEGRGVVTRATRALTTAAFRDFGLNRVEIRAGVENVRSRAVPERLGFTLEGVQRAYEKVGDRYLDHATYAMLAADWDAGTLAG